MKKPLRTTLLGLSTLLVLGTSGVIVTTTGTFAADKAAVLKVPAPPAVSTVYPTVKAITEWDDYTGRFEAIDNVALRSRVSGHLVAIHFNDGDLVKKGQTLFTIDPRPFQAEVDIAKAQVAQAQARLQLAGIELRRANRLVKTNAVSRSHVDQMRADFTHAKADKASAQAQLERAELSLAFTDIQAPLDGRIDRHNIDVGNLVTANTTLLTNIVSMEQMYVSFDVDQNAYLKYTRYHQAGTRVSSRDHANPVQIALGDREAFSLTGKMDYVANTINQSTGTIRARAIVDNPNGLLTPGLFARVKLLARDNATTLMIPDKAINTQQSDRVVFVVNPDAKVETRKVTLGPRVDGLRVIRSGLNEADQVIVSGFHKVTAGGEVTANLITPMPEKLAAHIQQ